MFNKFYFQVVTSAINEPAFENQFCCYIMSDVSQDGEKRLVRLVMLSYENAGEKMADLVWFVWVLKHYIPYTFMVIRVHCVWERCAKRVCIYRNISKKCMTRLKKGKPCFKRLIFLAAKLPLDIFSFSNTGRVSHIFFILPSGTSTNILPSLYRKNLFSRISLFYL